ncbi:MAG: zinc ribbon domain-containing protein, partial [Deltaproteobacteria bacterium]
MLRAQGGEGQAPGPTLAASPRSAIQRTMPLYEYRCTACRKRVTVLTLRVSEESHPTCEHCGST